MSKMPCGHDSSSLAGFSPDFIGDGPKRMTVGTTYCTACEEAARDKDSGYWLARFNTLFDRCLDVLPMLENQHSTPETTAFCRLMWELCDDQGLKMRRGYARR